jgi:hypothetical protein
LGQVSIVSHSYQTYFGFPELDLNLDCELRDHVITRFASNDQIKLKSEHEVMGRENQDEEQGEKTPSDSARTQNTITTHSATHPNTNKYSANTQTN